jgi:predicted GNAT family acetyltransferase
LSSLATTAKSLADVAGSSRFDCRMKRQQIDLAGNVVDQFDCVADLLRCRSSTLNKCACEVRGATVELRPVSSDADWQALQQLVLTDHAEGRRTSNLDMSPEVSAGMVAGYRTKSGAYHFHLAMQNGVPVAYGGYAAAPNGAGMIEDLFTLQSARRQGIASAMIAAFSDRLRAAGCHTIFLGALATEQPKHLYARLGFRPVMLARTWVRETLNKG